MSEFSNISQQVPQQQPTTVQQPTVYVVQQPTNPADSVPPSDYLGLSIFSLICCCWLFGIIALMNSLQTRSHITSGRLAEARASSDSARTFNFMAIGFGVIIYTIAAIPTIGVTIAVAAANS